MTTPVDKSTNVGYCVAADVYCSFTEYYGGGTVYGWRHLYIGDEVVRGAGKTKRELIAAGAVQEEAICPAVPADVTVLDLDPAPEGSPEATPEAPEAAPEAPEAAPEAPEAAPEAPEAAASEVPSPKEVPEAPKVEISVNKVVVKFKGFSVTLNTKVTKDLSVDVSEAGEVVFTL